jgi:hypothetical protein
MSSRASANGSSASWRKQTTTTTTTSGPNRPRLVLLRTSRPPPERRAIPPPPRREGASNGAEEELGIVSKALVGLTLFFYLVALFATTSRAFLGDSQPAPIQSEGGALATRTPAPVPESIRGTRAGEMWQEKIAGTIDEGDVFV